MQEKVLLYDHMMYKTKGVGKCAELHFYLNLTKNMQEWKQNGWNLTILMKVGEYVICI